MREYIVPVDGTYRDYEEMFIGFIRQKHELIRCKDCKYFSTDFNGYNHCDLYMDALSPWAESRYSPSESDYCSQAERKEE